MTRKIAGLTGSLSVLLAGVILIGTVSMDPWSAALPQVQFDSVAKREPEAQEMHSVEAKPSEQAKEPAMMQEAEWDLETSRVSDPGNISGINKGALSAVLYGAVSEKKAEQKPSSLTSLVLASQVPAAELGTFEVTYPVTPEEYEMLLYCVEYETRSGSLEHKALITQVILNRVQGVKFPFTVAEVLMAPNQFDVMPGYENRGEWTPSEVTCRAVDLVLSGEAPNYAQGVLYFCNPYIVGEGNWFDTTRPLVCEIEGHRFYR